MLKALKPAMPLGVRIAVDLAIERAGFVRAADVLEHEWNE
jgi:hypothetical protein